MAGPLIATILIVLFAAGFFLGGLLIVAVGIWAEDKAAVDRRDGSILLHEEPAGPLTRGVRRLNGVGRRTPPGQHPGDV
jgi:hypothetical protein